MRGLKAAPGYAGALLVAGVATWWLAGLAVQAGIGFPEAAATSARAAGILILGQWMLIAVLVPVWQRATRPGDMTPADVAPADVLGAALTVSAPAWPLLVLLWAAGGIAAWKLAVAQAGALALAGPLALGVAAIGRLPVPAETGRILALLPGLAIAAGIWLKRTAIGAWIGS